MIPISMQYGQHVEFCQNVSLFDERITSLRDTLATYKLPEALAATGLKFSLRDGRLHAEVLGNNFLMSPSYALMDGRLVGCVEFSKLRDWMFLRQKEVPLGEPLFKVAVDIDGALGAALRGRPFAWTGSLENEQTANEFCRQICIELVGIARGLLVDYFEANR